MQDVSAYLMQEFRKYHLESNDTVESHWSQHNYFLDLHKDWLKYRGHRSLHSYHHGNHLDIYIISNQKKIIMRPNILQNSFPSNTNRVNFLLNHIQMVKNICRIILSHIPF